MSVTLINIDTELVNPEAVNTAKFAQIPGNSATFTASEVAKMHFYTGIFAPSKTYYIDIHFTTNTVRTFLMNGQQTYQCIRDAARECGITVIESL